MLFMNVEMFGTLKCAMPLWFSNFDFCRFTRPIRQVCEPTPTQNKKDTGYDWYKVERKLFDNKG